MRKPGFASVRRLCLLLMMAVAASAFAQQMADPSFDTRVQNPAYRDQHPVIVIDQAHHNFHTASGRYKPLAELLKHDGYKIVAGKKRFSADGLRDCAVLVIANAMGSDRMMDDDAGKPPFTQAEYDTVVDWVRSGGSLLLIADHAPFGSAAAGLARALGADMSQGFTVDAHHMERSPSQLVFERSDGLLGDHPITRGRNQSETLNRVITFTGESLQGPEGSTAILKLAETAEDVHQLSPQERRAAMRGERSRRAQKTSAAGRAQAIAFELGKGRVVVLGEAAVLSAQVIRGPMAEAMGEPGELKMGMNVPGSDDRQFALNIFHWLSHAL